MSVNGSCLAYNYTWAPSIVFAMPMIQHYHDFIRVHCINNRPIYTILNQLLDTTNFQFKNQFYGHESVIDTILSCKTRFNRTITHNNSHLRISEDCRIWGEDMMNINDSLLLNTIKVAVLEACYCYFVFKRRLLRFWIFLISLQIIFALLYR